MSRQPFPPEALLDLRRRLAGLPPRSAQRRTLVQETAELYGLSESSLYRALRAHARPKAMTRADRGVPRVLSPAEMERYCEVVAALKIRTSNRKGRHLSTGEAIRLLEEHGVETPDGLLRAPPGVLARTTVNRYLKQWGFDYATLTRVPPAVRFEARHSNDCWQFDLSPSDLKHVKRPAWFEAARGHPLLMIYSVVDDRKETLYHLHEPETEAEANAWLARFLIHYNQMPHRSQPHSRIEDWLASLPPEGVRAMCAWERCATFAREPERRKVGVDARVSLEGTRYVVRITGDDKEGQAQLGYFIDNDEPYPVIATTSRLLATGVDAKTCKLIVLDQTINSMTQFKQILGRGTRIREDYNKLYFTIMDFKNATRLFQDPELDGEPVTVYEPRPDEPIVAAVDPTITDSIDDTGDASGPDTEAEPPGHSDDDLAATWIRDPMGRQRYTIDDIRVRTAIERSQYLDADGRLVTEEYRVLHRDEIRRTLRREFFSLADFLRPWTEAERKQAVLDELSEQGVPMEVLREAVPNGEALGAFDLVAQIPFDQPPVSRRERAENVRKRNYFGKYGADARAVLDALLDKYADHGIADIEDPKVLELPPFDRIGSKTRIRRGIFGGADKFSEALTELERQLYRDSA